VLVEGFRRDGLEKLEVHRPGLGEPPRWPGDPSIVVVASDVPLPTCDRPVLALGDPDRIVAWLLARVRSGGGPG